MAINGYLGVNGVARKFTNGYLGVSGVARKFTNGYLGVSGVARKFTNDPETLTMTEAWAQCSSTGNGTLTLRKSGAATVYDQVEGTGWMDAWHNLVIVMNKPCIPTAIKFTTPVIVNSQQSTEIKYRIYGSNSTWNSNISSMSWDTLVSETTIAHSWQGNQKITIPINTTKNYKYLRMMCTWFYGANDYHGVCWINLSVEGI